MPVQFLPVVQQPQSPPDSKQYVPAAHLPSSGQIVIPLALLVLCVAAADDELRVTVAEL